MGTVTYETEPEVAKTARPEPVVNQVLLDAARLVGRAWCQHSSVREVMILTDAGTKAWTAYCAWAAISVSHTERSERLITSHDGYEIAEALGFNSPADLVAWNDAPGRTADEVVERLERGAYGL